MKNNLIQLQEVDQYRDFLGHKTLNLKKCVDWGFEVPKFIALPSYISSKLLGDEIFRKKIAFEVRAILPCNRYAVRSSALIEDGKNQSYAGQFLTRIDLSGDGLAVGIRDVLKQAEIFLQGDLAKFSLIIQEYIPADISGVTFTRNPNGGREIIIEHGDCEGEKIVSGEIKPDKLEFYWSDEAPKKFPRPSLLGRMVEVFKELEHRNGFPQDIEWCLRGDQFYLLQTRPITTITKNSYEQILFLEKSLPQGEKYYFEKTEISEIAPRPATATLDLLRLIYGKNGPVDKVYKKFGVNYENTEFLKIIGNELYVDKEKEIRGLLPAYSYLQDKNFSPKFHRLPKILPTIKNFFFLNRIKTSGYAEIFKRLKARIEYDEQRDMNLQSVLDNFLSDYGLIFETNLLSGLSLKKADMILKNEPISFAEILASFSIFVDMSAYQVEMPQGLKGNSLDFMDESVFVADKIGENKSSERVMDWWKYVPGYRKKMLQTMIVEAIIYGRLRELGRWLTVKNTILLRTALLECAVKHECKIAKNIIFANLNDVLKDKVDEATCSEVKKNFVAYDSFCLPDCITSEPVMKKTKTSGVSCGMACGILQNREYIEAEKNKSEKVVLYTEMLSPDLTKYFDKISGIVSNNGSLLSHLAIMAREKGMPVIVGFSLAEGKIKLGDHVQIDGSSGEIIRI